MAETLDFALPVIDLEIVDQEALVDVIAQLARRPKDNLGPWALYVDDYPREGRRSKTSAQIIVVPLCGLQTAIDKHVRPSNESPQDRYAQAFERAAPSYLFKSLSYNVVLEQRAAQANQQRSGIMAAGAVLDLLGVYELTSHKVSDALIMGGAGLGAIAMGAWDVSGKWAALARRKKVLAENPEVLKQIRGAIEPVYPETNRTLKYQNSLAGEALGTDQ